MSPLPVPSPGVLHTVQLGATGPRVAFCHGLFGQGKNWTSVAKQLSREHRVTLVDLPNHGRSGWTDELSYPAMAHAVGDALAEQVPGEAVTLVGHSMGGKVAMALALLRPELVARLCVVDVSPVAYTQPSGFADYVRGMRALDLRNLPDRATAERELQPWVPDAGVRSFLLQNLRRDGSVWRWQMNLELLGDHLDALADWPELAVQAYGGPTLWLAGSESSYVIPEYGPRMRELFPRVQLVTVKNSGHWVHSEQPAVFLGVLRRFLQR